MCHAHVSEPGRGGSNIKVLNDDSIDDALDPSNIIASRVGAMGRQRRGRDERCERRMKAHLGGGNLGLGSGRSPVSEEGGGN